MSISKGATLIELVNFDVSVDGIIIDLVDEIFSKITETDFVIRLPKLNCEFVIKQTSSV
jgi:hypothetical protein